MDVSERGVDLTEVHLAHTLFPLLNPCSAVVLSQTTSTPFSLIHSRNDSSADTDASPAGRNMQSWTDPAPPSPCSL